MTPQLQIIHDGTVYFPAVVDKIEWSTERAGAPGSLNFYVIQDSILKMANGDPVRFTYGGYKIFYGFIFEVRETKDTVVQVKAYDQLRYFKNKGFYNYKEKETGELISMIAEDFRLNCGELESTGYPVTRIEKDKTLFDMVQNSYNATLQNTGQMYVFYDDFGHLTLKNIAHMAFNLLIDDTAAKDYNYTRSIDKQTYNQVKLTYDNPETGQRDVYIAQSGENINRWGLLVYTDTIDKPENGPAKAEALLNLYNAETRNLTIKEAFGDVNIRAGCLLVIKLALSDTTIHNLMLVEKCKHVFKENEHWMDLTLRGGEFVA